ncbi:MAG: hypothetical protein ACK5MG_10265 [Bacteroidales bacterium]
MKLLLLFALFISCFISKHHKEQQDWSFNNKKRTDKTLPMR